MDATLDVLPGEGQIESINRQKVRVECDECGEPAHFKHAYLYEGYRRNPASSAYAKDDCTWCCDVAVYTCKTCPPKTPDGCDSGHSQIPASARFAHMFLKWRAI